MSSATKAFDMGKMAIGGIGQMLDSVEFVKRAWSTLNIPSTLVPTVDIEELDKRIADLKAVEQWLNVNLSMLRGTIQGLEIQRGTLATVRAFGATLGNIAVPPAEPPAASRSRTASHPTSRTTSEPPAPSPAAFPFPASASSPASAPSPASASPPASASSPAAARSASAARSAAGADAETGAGADAPPADEATAGKAESSPMLPGLDPSAWWNLLQQNFNQVAQAALSGSGLQAATANLAKAAAAASGAAKPAPARRATGGSAPEKKKVASRGKPAPRARAPRNGG